jgi:hypothetical protein
MKPSCKKFYGLSIALVIVGLLTLGAGVASAQTGIPDVYSVNYYSNLQASIATDQIVRIDNPGLTYASLCAMIYVFNEDQQLDACCGCLESHNNLHTLSVKGQLVNNTLTRVPRNNGVIKIISSTPNGGGFNGNGCDPTQNVRPTRTLRAWGTHFQAPRIAITETEFQPADLGANELANLQAQCFFVNLLGSGNGHCSCGTQF